MAGVSPTNPAKDTSNKPTAKNDVADTINATETVIETFPRTPPSQLPTITSKELVALTNSNPPTVQPPKLIANNDTADTDTHKKFTITFDPTKVVMVNAANINQSTNNALKDEWGYELLNDMYVQIGYVELSTNGNTVYCKDCKKYPVMR